MGETNGVGEAEVTVTSGLHTQAESESERTNRGERATSGGGSGQDPKSGDVAQSRGSISEEIESLQTCSRPKGPEEAETKI